MAYAFDATGYAQKLVERIAAAIAALYRTWDTADDSARRRAYVGKRRWQKCFGRVVCREYSDRRAVHDAQKNGCTKPLYYNGTIVEGLSLVFEEGRVVSFDAERGKNTIAQLLAQDEGARYLGEVALVPHDSPISNTGLVFYNTLIDENAAHHIALGNAYASCVAGGEQMDQASLAARGANESIVHVDFMIGSAEMDIDGTTKDGRTIPLFRKGAWAHPIEHIVK
jgi:hypothetical protein